MEQSSGDPVGPQAIDGLNSGQLMALISTVMVLQTAAVQRPLPVAVSAMLPLLLLPLGEHVPSQNLKLYPMVKLVLDSAAGVSLGLLKFWESFAKMYPHLVAEFGPINHNEYMEITIGGIGNDAPPSHCTHYIGLKTPFFLCTAKLRKCRFFPQVAEFVGLDVHAEGNAPAASKNDAFRKLSKPNLFSDLNMLIGCFGFYQEHLPLFEVRIGRWRAHQKLRPPPGTPRDVEMKILSDAWIGADDDLLQDLKDAILSKPILRRPNSKLRFYLKTDWSKKAQAAALLQPHSEDAEALESMLREAAGGKCEFDLTKSGLRLFPLAFISRRTSEIEESYHSYVGEACAGVWAIEKFRPWLFGKEFTWITDCSGLRKFFEGSDIPTHMIQRWRMQLLRYDFTIVHRPGSEGLTWELAAQLAEECTRGPDWVLVTGSVVEKDHLQQIQGLLDVLVWKGLTAVMSFHNLLSPESMKKAKGRWHQWLNAQADSTKWELNSFPVKNSKVGGAVDVDFKVLVLSNPTLASQIKKQQRSLVLDDHLNQQGPQPLLAMLDKGNEISECVVTPRDVTHVEAAPNHPSFRSKVVSKAEVQQAQWIPVHSVEHPSPNLADPTIALADGQFLVEVEDPIRGKIIRSTQWTEVARTFGHSEELIEQAVNQHWSPVEIMAALKHQPPRETLRAVFSFVFICERLCRSQEHTKTKAQLDPYRNDATRVLAGMVEQSGPKTTTIEEIATHKDINRWTTIPLPTQKQWVEAVQADADLNQICEALRNDSHLERHQITRKAYFEAWDKGKLLVDDGILHYIDEPKAIDVRQLLRRVVPRSLQHVIITAYHSTPLAGHVGMHKTFWRIAARYWWPSMCTMVREVVLGCAHCKLTNATGHQAQQVLEALSCDGPFDVVSIDIWTPGKLSNRHGNSEVLTCTDTMTGFASADFLKSTSSEEVSMRCFSAFFIPNGLPRLVIIDAGSEFKGVLVAMCDSLGIAYHVLAAEDHNGILYGTNIIRSFVAKGRVFPFPIQLKEESNPPRIPTGQGEAAIQHLETYFPLWAKQQTLLQILVEERRERHRELKNLGKKQRTFSVGDLVVAKRQLKSDASRGISAKLSIDKVKGPYRVLEPIGDRSYMIQKMPIFQGQGKPGKPRKVSGAALERIPSTLVVNKRVDSTDTRLAALEKPLVHNPLEKALGFYQFGRYVHAPKTADFAFDRVEDLWQIEVEDSDSESEGESEGNEARAARAAASSNNPRDSPDTRAEAAAPAANNIEAGKETPEPSTDDTDAGQVDGEGTAFVGPTLADRIKAASRTASRKRSLASVDSQEEPQPKRRPTGLESFYDKVRASRDKL